MSNSAACLTDSRPAPAALARHAETRPASSAPLYWMALGTFAVGTEGFMIAAILPKIAADLSVGLEAAGQLVTIFALTYAISSPVLTALTGRVDRRRLLILAMTAFAGANILAALASGYWALVAARILLAISAGLYTPNANALAGALVAPERRGRALAIVTGGLSVAIALGVPLGAFVGTHLGWRMTFVGVAVLAVIAVAGLLAGLPRGIGADLTTASLRERIAIARQPAAFATLLVTTLWAIGSFTVYTYVAPLLASSVGLDGTGIGYALFLWGAAAFVGLVLGGTANDRFGGTRAIAIALPLMALALAALSLASDHLSQSAALIPTLVAVIVWGMTHWGFFPPQQARLIGIVGMKGAPIILSLNASFMYLGFSIGAAIGSFVLIEGDVADLGWVGAIGVLAAFVLFLATRRSAVASGRAA